MIKKKKSPSNEQTDIFVLVLLLVQILWCKLWSLLWFSADDLTLSRWSAPAPGPSYTAPQLGQSSSPPSWTELLPYCCAESLRLAVSARAGHRPPLQLCGNKHIVPLLSHQYWIQEYHDNEAHKKRSQWSTNNEKPKNMAKQIANTKSHL